MPYSVTIFETFRGTDKHANPFNAIISTIDDKTENKHSNPNLDFFKIKFDFSRHGLFNLEHEQLEHGGLKIFAFA